MFYSKYCPSYCGNFRGYPVRKWVLNVIEVSRSALDIFTHKRIYYTDENSLIFQGYFFDRSPTLRQWSFTSVNFNQILLMAPTFVKRWKLISTPDRYTVKNPVENYQSIIKYFTMIDVGIIRLYCEFSTISGVISQYLYKVCSESLILPLESGDIKLRMINMVNFNHSVTYIWM